MCGADFPLKVSMLGESTAMSYADDLRPPEGNPQCIARAAALAAERASVTRRAGAERADPKRKYALGAGAAGHRAAGGDRACSICAASRALCSSGTSTRRRQPAGRPMSIYRAGRGAARRYSRRRRAAARPRAAGLSAQRNRPITRRSISRRSSARLPALGPMRGPNTTAAIMPAAVTPPATLACPLVSALDRWVSEGVQPAALRWFGSPVAEIKQISVLLVPRNGRLGHARVFPSTPSAMRSTSPAFTLADGRKITVQGRLARHAGRAGLPARRAALRLRDFHHGVVARL